jgi:hypothetical protein
MSVIRGIVQEEEERLKSLLEYYSEQLKEFPRGSVRIRELKGNQYAYLVYREEGRVKNEYLGSILSEKVQQTIEQANQRNKIRAQQKEAMVILKEVKGMLRG